MSGTELFATFLGSVALLLWGVRMVRTGMTRAFGAALRKAIATYARTRIGAFFAGVGITGILQSSTATTMLLASFSARGLIALPLALAVVLGADVGSAVVAQVFSLDVKWLWTVLVALGVLVFMSTEADKARGVARIFIGLGFMLLALVHIGACRRAAQGLRAVPLAAHWPCRRAGARLPRSDRGVVAGAFEPLDRAAGDVACGGRRPARPACARAGARRERRRRARPVSSRLRPRRPPAAACRSAISS